MYFTFENPVYLWYLASLPLLVMTHFLSLRTTKIKAMRFANFHTLKRIEGRKFITRNYLLLVLRLIILALLIAAASGIRVWYKTDQSDTNYVIAIDSSSSMAAKDFPPNRLEVAKTLATEFVNNINAQAKVGVLSFSGVTLVQQTLTEQHYEATLAIQSIGVTKAGGTDIPGAIITGVNLLLAEPEKGKAVVLFTDGSTTLGSFMDGSINEALAYAQQHKVVVHSIGIGSESVPIGYLPELYNISATYDLENLQLITNSTGGVLLEARANPEDALQTLLGQAEESYVSIRVDLGLLVLGILLLFIEWGLINTRFRRIT